MELNEQHLKILEEEQKLHQQLKLAVRTEVLARRVTTKEVNLNQEILDLQDEASYAHVRDLPSLLSQLHVSQSLASRSRDGFVPDLRSPYFAHIRLQEDGKTKDILIGQGTFINNEFEIMLVDWRHAPVAKIFFNYQEGDHYEEAFPSRIAKGQVIMRRIVAFNIGQLRSIKTPTAAISCSNENKWMIDDNHDLELTGGEATAARSLSFGSGKGGHHSQQEVIALLDKKQFQLLEASDEKPLLILGSAGSGKTTVALHRVAHLHYQNRKKYPQKKILVIVPEMGLAKLSKKLLDSLNMRAVQIQTYDQWILRQGQFLLRNTPKKLCSNTPSRVIRFKRHVAVSSVFSELAKIKENRLAQYLKRELTCIPNVEQIFIETNGVNLKQKISSFNHFCHKHKANKSKMIQDQIQAATRYLQDNVYDLNMDRQALFSNQKLLEKIVSNSQNDLDKKMIKEVVRHSQQQFFDLSFVSQMEISQDQIASLDNRNSADDNLYEEMGTIDIEDYSILIQLLQFYTGGYQTQHGAMHSYSHMVIDEAQELSELELNILGDSLDPEGSISIAGDAVQHTDPTAVFKSWDRVLQALGEEPVGSHHLDTSYRCPKSIVDFAFNILSEPMRSQRPTAVRAGLPVKFSHFGHDGLAYMEISKALEALSIAEPMASIAVIAKDQSSAQNTYKGLEDLPTSRLVDDGNFSFKPGIDVTHVSQVKGLEFDYVIIPDCNHSTYSETEESRRALHVAATRTVHQLWVVAIQTPSSLIKDLAKL